MQAYVDGIYDQFVSIVAEGRSLDKARVDELAQGRVWVGSDALANELVDQIGTLKDAIAEAASLAGLIAEEDYSVVCYPKPLTVFEQLMESLGKHTDEPSILAGTPFEAIGLALQRLEENMPSGVYAQLPYSIEIR